MSLNGWIDNDEEERKRDMYTQVNIVKNKTKDDVNNSSENYDRR